MVLRRFSITKYFKRTLLEKIDWGSHWRIGLLFIPCLIVSYLVWTAVYPEAQWFMRFWASGTTGLLGGLILGTIWQLWNKDRRPKTSVGLLVFCGFAWGALSFVALTTIKGSMEDQQMELAKVRSISKKEILEVVISPKGVRQPTPTAGTRILPVVPIHITDKEVIVTFGELLKKAYIYSPNHERSLKEYQIEIVCKEETVTYSAWVPERHRNDISFSFQTQFGRSHILIPGLKTWLDRLSLPQTETVDTKTGHLVAYWVKYPDMEEPVLVTKSHAVLLVWGGGYGRQFFLYDNVEKQIYKTTDFDKFLRQIDQLPHGISIQFFDKCCAPFACDMPQAEYQKLQKVLKKGNRKRTTSGFITCTCESHGLRFP